MAHDTICTACLALSLLLLCWVLGCHGNSCFPVKEGESCTLTCEGTGNSTHRTYFWDMGNSANPFIATCHGGRCNVTSGRFNATFTSMGQTFRSNLTIRNVTAADRNQIFTCISYDKLLDKSIDVKDWVLSETYHWQESPKPTCSAERLNPTSINVACEVAKVYPAITCQLPDSPEEKLVLNSPGFEYKLGPLRGNYYSATCSTNVTITKPGEHQYSVRVLPNVTHGDSVNALPVIKTNAINIHNVLKVFINKPSHVYVCPDKITNISLNCEAQLFQPDEMEFRWKFNHKPVSESVRSCGPSQRRGDWHFVTSDLNLTYNFSPGELDKEMLVECEVLSCNSSASSDKPDGKGTTLLEIHRPPTAPPQFKVGNMENISLVSLHQGENLTIGCKVDGGSPHVLAVSVKCVTSKGNHDLYDVTHNVSETGTSVTFDVSGSRDLCTTRCECFVVHALQCYNLNTSLYFSVSPMCKASGMAGQRSGNSATDVPYVIAGTLAGVVVCVLCGVLIACRAKIKDRCGCQRETSPPPTSQNPDNTDSQSLIQDDNL